MKLVPIANFGSNELPVLEPLKLQSPWGKFVEQACPAGLRVIQHEALPRILDERRNLLISAPTNSGKSFCAYIELLRAVRGGARAALIEPLRVLAKEQCEALQELIATHSVALGMKPSVRLSTGEFRHSDDFLFDPPPEEGEILVVTPERLEILQRNPDHDPFFAKLGSVVVDEAHLLFEGRRGRTLEGLLTGLMSNAELERRTPPRLLLLSATFPHPERVATWLSAGQIISTNRFPSLTIFADAMPSREAADKAITEYCREKLDDADNSVLVFVYQTRDAESLSENLGKALGVATGYCHSKMPSGAKVAALDAFRSREHRVLVASSSLAMGVNMPCSHVVIRDTVRPGAGILQVHQLLQMAGRAGRGNKPGEAIVFLSESDRRTPEDLKDLIRQQLGGDAGSHARRAADDKASAIETVAAILARQHNRGMDLIALRHYTGRSLTASSLADHVASALDWLEWWKLASTRHDQFNDGKWRLTVAGLTASRAGLPLPLAAGILQLFRDIIQVDETDRLLTDWTTFDVLLAIELLAERSPTLRRNSASLADALQAWMERHAASHTSTLWREWLHDFTEKSDDLAGSLGLTDEKGGRLLGPKLIRHSQLALLRTIVLLERSAGESVEQLGKRWAISQLAGIEEDWRDNRIWLASGIAQLADYALVSWHCNHVCKLSEVRRKRIRKALAGIRRAAYDICGRLTTCSPLGALLGGIRNQQKAAAARVGVSTIRSLEAAGIRNLNDLAAKTRGDLVELGVRSDLAAQLISYVRSAMR